MKALRKLSYGENQVKLVDVPEPAPGYEQVLIISGGYGVDAAFECSGSPAGLHDCMTSVKKSGRTVQVGLFGRSIEIDMDHLALKEVALKGAFTHNHKTWSKTIDLLASKKLDLKPLVSAEFALKDWQEAFRLSESGAGSKYLLCPSD